MKNKNLLGILINTVNLALMPVNLALMPVVFYLSFILSSFIVSKQFGDDTVFAPLKIGLLFISFSVVPMYFLNVITKYLLDRFVYEDNLGVAAR